ncbi:MAG: hypothetical protein ACXVB9_01155 [Bdellovibrionota bacterium]
MKNILLLSVLSLAGFAQYAHADKSYEGYACGVEFFFTLSKSADMPSFSNNVYYPTGEDVRNFSVRARTPVDGEEPFKMVNETMNSAHRYKQQKGATISVEDSVLQGKPGKVLVEGSKPEIFLECQKAKSPGTFYEGSSSDDSNVVPDYSRHH